MNSSSPVDSRLPRDSRRLWITWNDQIRNVGLAEAFRCRLLVLEYERLGPLLRYAACTIATVWTVLFGRYQTVFAQCPSVVCTALLGALKPIRGFKYVIDAHNVTFEYERSGWLLQKLVRFSFRQADFVLASNALLADAVRTLGSTPAILPDKLPEIGNHPLPERFQLGQRTTITCICSFASDEPLEELLKALASTPSGCVAFVTGSRERAKPFLAYSSPRLVFTGYLPRDEFEGLIRHSDLLIDLTTRPDCLVCGAYEALAVETPAILSNHRPLKSLFLRGFLFADNHCESYRACLEQYLDASFAYERDVAEYKYAFIERWNRCFHETELLLFGAEFTPAYELERQQPVGS